MGRGIEVRPVPPTGSVIVGQHTDGRPIYEIEIREPVGSEPAIRDGKEVWIRHPQTGEPIRQVFRTKYRARRRRFIIETLPNGTAFPNYHFEASPEEKARIDRQKKAQALQAAFFERAAQRGISDPDALLSALFREGDEQAPPPDGVPAVATDEDGNEFAYPRMVGPGLWELSNGDRMRGKKVDALEAEAALHETSNDVPSAAAEPPTDVGPAEG